MLDKARIATDPLSHNPTVYYKQAKYFSNQQDRVNEDSSKILGEGCWYWIHDFVATFEVNDLPIYMVL